jgi:hypothetical protein
MVGSVWDDGVRKGGFSVYGGGGGGGSVGVLCMDMSK